MDIYQDGNKKSIRRYYDDVLRCMKPTDPVTKCLDVGSGIGFHFEKMIADKFDGFVVDCVDLVHPKEVDLPEYVHSYRQLSAEKQFQLNETYDYIFCFEVIEHVDHTDALLKNCYNHLKDGGILFISHPNLAGLYARIELMLGYQPHVLEVSNKHANYGTGIFGKLNNPSNCSIHHIRGITYRAMRELLAANRFKIRKIVGNGAGGGY